MFYVLRKGGKLMAWQHILFGDRVERVLWKMIGNKVIAEFMRLPPIDQWTHCHEFWMRREANAVGVERFFEISVSEKQQEVRSKSTPYGIRLQLRLPLKSTDEEIKTAILALYS